MFQSILILAATEEGRWRLGIGDPTPIGWFTVVAYLAAAIACGACAVAERRALRRGEPARPALWLVISALLFFLGVNKQLDLQTLLATVGRDLARQQGWYANRRFYQGLFIAGLAVAGLVAMGLLAWLTRGLRRRFLVALVGIVFLFVFVLTRASSFHHVDVLLASELGGVRWNWILELGGIAIVAVGTVVAARDRRRVSRELERVARESADPRGTRSYKVGRGVVLPVDPPRRRWRR